jgi:hypothetical protein
MTATTKTPLGADTTVHKYYLDVDMGTPAVPIWVPLGGIYSFKPVQEPTVKDNSDFDSDWGSDSIPRQKWGVEAKIWRKRQVASPTEYDDAQEFLRAAGAHILGENVVRIRYYDMVENGPQEEAYQGNVAVAWKPDGGQTEEYDSITVTLYGQGNRAEIAHPAAAASVPTAASITPTTGVAAGGEAACIKGQYFTGATAVKIGVTAVTDYEVVDDYTIAIVTSAKAAGPYTVYVTNPTGTNATGPTFTYS